MKKLLQDLKIKDCKVVLSRNDIPKNTFAENKILESYGPMTRSKLSISSTSLPQPSKRKAIPSTSAEGKGHVKTAETCQDLEICGPTTTDQNTVKRRRIE